MIFVGLDVIGDYVTEINVTSPTGIRELNKKHGVDIGAMLVKAIARSLERRMTSDTPGLRAGLPPANDRMLTTCFLAALVHGIVILGVTFSVAGQRCRRRRRRRRWRSSWSTIRRRASPRIRTRAISLSATSLDPATP